MPATRQLTKVFEQHCSSVFAIEEVPQERISNYGIIQPRPIGDRLYEVLSLVEKPSVSWAPSKLGIIGRYILTPDIFTVLEETLPGKGGEIQITDGLIRLLPKQKIFGYKLEGTRYDVGTPLGMLKASIAFALENPDMASDLKEYMAKLYNKRSGGKQSA